MSLQAASLYALVGIQGAGQSVRELQGVSNQVNKTQGTLGQLAKNAGQVGHGMLQVGQGLLRVAEVVGVAALAATGGAARIGTSFQAMTELIHTQAGASQDEVDKMRLGIQAMVHEVGTAPIKLAEGLYHIESVGVRGSAALDILRASALGAKVGLADMESVTNALTAVWFSGIKGAKSMTDAMAILDGIVGVGNMHLQDLTDSFKSGILGTSATYGVDIRSLGAAIATLTDAGVPADIAATRLNNTLTHLAAPVKGAISVLKGLGLGQFDLANDLRKPDGIFVALKDLHDHLVKVGEIKDGLLTPKGAADLSKIFGGSRFGATAMQLLTQMDRVQGKYDLITKRSETFGDNVKKTMETAGFVWGQFTADVQNDALAFADGFLPALARLGKRLDGFVVAHRADFAKLGVDLGQWIDKIDWKQVEDGANSFVGILKDALAVISKIPPQVDLAIVGFLGLNKVSGGLLGRGLEDIAGGVLGGLGTISRAGVRGILGKISPVAGSAFGALTSTPVFVTNWPLGFGMGGGVLPAAAGAGAAAVGMSTLAAVTSLFAIAGVEVVVAGFAHDVLKGMGIDLGKRNEVGPFAIGGPTEAQRVRGEGGARVIEGFVRPNVTAGGFDRRMIDTDRGLDSGALHSMTSQMVAIMSRVADRQSRVLDQLHKDFLEAIGGLRKKDQTPAEVQRLAKELAAAVTKGVGNAEHTKEGLALLRAQLKNADPATARVLRQAIAILAGKLPNREFVARQLAVADRIFHSGETTKQKIGDLTRIQRSLLDHGDTKAAAKITAEIREEKRALKAATAAGAEVTAAAVRAKDASVAFNSFIKLVVDGLTISQAQASSTQFVRNAQRP